MDVLHLQPDWEDKSIFPTLEKTVQFFYLFEYLVPTSEPDSTVLDGQDAN